MSTRGAAGFRLNETDKVQYNHFDSYPSGLGRDVITFVREHTDAEIEDAARNIKLIDGETPPTEEEIEQYKEFANTNVSTGEVEEWYVLLRETQGDLSAYTDAGVTHMIDASTFLIDSLFCEWAYIVNLDTKLLEVYKGFNTEPSDKGRYASIKDEVDYQRSTDYYGVTLLTTIPLDYLRRLDEDQVDTLIASIDRMAHPEDEDGEWDEEVTEAIKALPPVQ